MQGVSRSVKDESEISGMNVDGGTICRNKNVAGGMSFPGVGVTNSVLAMFTLRFL